MPQGVLLDMDGVLVDTEELIARAAVEMFREKGLQVTPEDFLPFVGTGEIRYLGGVAEKYHFPLDIPEAKKRVYEIYDEIARDGLKVLPGVRSFIEECRERGLKMAVATSADRVKMLINLREGDLPQSWFDALITAEDVTHKKPAPDVYLKAAEKLGLSPSHCLVVEDAPAGIEAGKKAGAHVLGLTTSFPPERLTAADWIARDLAHVPEGAMNW